MSFLDRSVTEMRRSGIIYLVDDQGDVIVTTSTGYAKMSATEADSYIPCMTAEHAEAESIKRKTRS